MHNNIYNYIHVGYFGAKSASSPSEAVLSVFICKLNFYDSTDVVNAGFKEESTHVHPHRHAQ